MDKSLADGSLWMPRRTAANVAATLAEVFPRHAEQLRTAGQQGFHILMPEVAALLDSGAFTKTHHLLDLFRALDREVGHDAADVELANALEISFIPVADFHALLQDRGAEAFPHLWAVIDAAVRRGI